MRNGGDLLEAAEVHGNGYGTPRAPVEDVLAQGRDMLFDIDWQGARQVREALGADVVSVFILPPSMKELRGAAGAARRGFDGHDRAAARQRQARDRALAALRLRRRQRRPAARLSSGGGDPDRRARARRARRRGHRDVRRGAARRMNPARRPRPRARRRRRDLWFGRRWRCNSMCWSASSARSRSWRFVGYFTILSNMLAGVALTLAALRRDGCAAGAGGGDGDRHRRDRLFAAAAADWDPQGADKLADALLHDVAPVVYVAWFRAARRAGG